MRLALLVVSLVISVISLRCGAREAAPPPTDDAVLTDDLGRVVDMDLPAQRVVTLAPSLTETVFAAGAGARLVGVSTVDDYPPAIENLPRYSLFPAIDYEAITALTPDLVLATDEVNSTRDAQLFTDLSLPVFFLSFETVGDVLASIRTAGRLLGTKQAADEKADALAASLLDLKERTSDVHARPLVLVLVGDETLYSFGGRSYVRSLVEQAGGTFATASFDAKSATLSEEFVLATKPDVIIGAFGDDYDVRRLLDLYPTWSIVPAIQNERVYSMDPSLLVRPGPRLVDAAWQMARWFHPSLFDDATPDA